MTKSQLRGELIYQIRSLRDRFKLTITMAWSAIIWIAAVVNNNVGVLLFMVMLTLLTIASVYLVAKGK